MSLNFLYNNGLGPGAGGCTGQSPQNCDIDSPGCCSMSAGPILSSKLRVSQNVSFRPMNIAERIQFVQAQNNPALREKDPVRVNLPTVPANGIGVI